MEPWTPTSGNAPKHNSQLSSIYVDLIILVSYHFGKQQCATPNWYVVSVDLPGSYNVMQHL